MTIHQTTVTPVRRRTFDIARIILIVRCTGCNFRLESTDGERARREAMRHEAASRELETQG